MMGPPSSMMGPPSSDRKNFHLHPPPGREFRTKEKNMIWGLNRAPPPLSNYFNHWSHHEYILRNCIEQYACSPALPSHRVSVTIRVLLPIMLLLSIREAVAMAYKRNCRRSLVIGWLITCNIMIISHWLGKLYYVGDAWVIHFRNEIQHAWSTVDTCIF